MPNSLRFQDEVLDASTTDLYQVISVSVPPLLARSRRLTRNLVSYGTELVWLRKSYFLPLAQFCSLGVLHKNEMKNSLQVMIHLMEGAGKQEAAARKDLDELLVQVSKIRAVTYAVLSTGSVMPPAAGVSCAATSRLAPAQNEDIKRLLSVLMAAVHEQQSAGRILQGLLVDCTRILARLQSDEPPFAKQQGWMDADKCLDVDLPVTDFPELALCR